MVDSGNKFVNLWSDCEIKPNEILTDEQGDNNPLISNLLNEYTFLKNKIEQDKDLSRTNSMRFKILRILNLVVSALALESGTWGSSDGVECTQGAGAIVGLGYYILQLKRVENDLSKFNLLQEKINDNISQLNKQAEELNNNIKTLETKLERNDVELQAIKSTIKTGEEQKSALENNLKITNKNLEKVNNALKISLLNNLCRWLVDKIPLKHIADKYGYGMEYIKELQKIENNLNTQVHELDKKIKKYDFELEGLNEKLKKLDEDIKTKKEELDKAKMNLKKIDANKETLSILEKAVIYKIETLKDCQSNYRTWRINLSINSAVFIFITVVFTANLFTGVSQGLIIAAAALAILVALFTFFSYCVDFYHENKNNERLKKQDKPVANDLYFIGCLCLGGFLNLIAKCVFLVFVIKASPALLLIALGFLVSGAAIIAIHTIYKWYVEPLINVSSAPIKKKLVTLISDIVKFAIKLMCLIGSFGWYFPMKTSKEIKQNGNEKTEMPLVFSRPRAETWHAGLNFRLQPTR